MAGNESVARQQAYTTWKTASDNRNSKPEDVAKLKATLDAAVSVENTATGTPGQRRY